MVDRERPEGMRPCPATARPRHWRGAALFLLCTLAGPAPAETRRLEMTLRQAVETAVKRSRAVRTSLLRREASRNALRVPDHAFRPVVDVFGSASGEDRRDAGRSGTLDGSAALRLALRTGGNVGLRLFGAATDAGPESPTTRGYGYALDVSQPLLRGRGSLVATAGQRIARLGDEQAGYGLEASVSDLVDGAVYAYRDLLAAREAVAIDERSLDAARELASTTAALIESGRLPAVEKVQSETDIANRELQLLVSRNAMAQAALALVAILDLDLDTEIVPVDAVAVEKRTVDPDDALKTLLARSPEYRTIRVDLEAARLALAVADNGRLVDLVASAGVAQDRVASEWTRNVSAGLTLRHVLFDPSLDVAYVGARLRVSEAEIALAKAEDTLRIDLRQRLRNLEVAWRRLELATRARELSTRQMEVEKEKLQAGRSASFQVVRLQNDLDVARSGELVATISYANEVTALDRALGRTLETWGVDLASLRVAEAPR